jgi:hypothetical protein
LSRELLRLIVIISSSRQQQRCAGLSRGAHGLSSH